MWHNIHTVGQTQHETTLSAHPFFFLFIRFMSVCVVRLPLLLTVQSRLVAVISLYENRYVTLLMRTEFIKNHHLYHWANSCHVPIPKTTQNNILVFR